MLNETGTVRLHRVLRAPAERVYKAFTEKSALEYWLPPYGFIGTVHEIDVQLLGHHLADGNRPAADRTVYRDHRHDIPSPRITSLS